MKHVLIPTKLNAVAKEILEDRDMTVIQEPDGDLLELAQQYPETEALIVRSNKVSQEVIDAFPKLRLIVRAGSGYNTIDTKYARRQKIDVMNTPGANANAVAEEVIALILAYCRHVCPADRSVREGLWEKKKFMGRELAEKTVGIVGLGNIGQLVARRLEGFDVKVLGYDPLLSNRRAEELGIGLVSLPELFSRSDYVTLHVPETDETRGMVNKDLLSLMKPGAVLVNCARAGVVVEDDIRAVKAEKNIGFVNDVYPSDAAGDKSVADIADVMLPHLGASTVEANTNAARRAAEQLVAYAERGVTKFVVNKQVPDDLDVAYQELAYDIALLARHYLGTHTRVRRIECSFYGELKRFAKWFLSPIVAGISADFDALSEPQEAEDYLNDRKVDFEVRDTDSEKGYGNSITIDLLEGEELIRQVSVRGTITEGKLMVSRINNFEDLYFDPRGASLIVVYEDRPGVLAKITGAVADSGINIDDIRAPHEHSGSRSLAVLKTNRRVAEEMVSRIKTEVGAEVVFSVSIP
ncbi:MAG: ACT domain-containing protein [Candidatus Pacebacteria bacterium]|nr:ACT domain-containing protein [Candidatus Paceibacterota bacterium]